MLNEPARGHARSIISCMPPALCHLNSGEQINGGNRTTLRSQCLLCLQAWASANEIRPNLGNCLLCVKHVQPFNITCDPIAAMLHNAVEDAGAFMIITPNLP